MKQIAASPDTVCAKHKVVITRQDGTVAKGYFCVETPADLKTLARDLHSSFHEELTKCYLPDDDSQPELDWSQVKAVFFVCSFQGDSECDSVRFYSNGPDIQNIWIEIGFRDGEVIEGCVRNSIDHLKAEGFFLYPSSPDTNNILMYVNKSSIVSYRVLGFRMMEEE